MGDFDSVKVGVCDAYWTPSGSETEVFLGLTKGGCELTYTPEWYDLNTDRYGKSPTDSSLVGETIIVKIPLAETDLNKIKMFAHTGTATMNGEIVEKVSFGRFPGFRLGALAGRLRLHPVSMETDKSEDVILYKAVNKAPLQLNYKLDEERIFSAEFNGMIQRNHINGSLLFEIGDSTIGDVDITLGADEDEDGLPDNLIDLVIASNGSIWVEPEIFEGLSTVTLESLRTANVKAFTIFDGWTYDITSLVTFTGKASGGVSCLGNPVCVSSQDHLPDELPLLPADLADSEDYVTISSGVDNGKIIVDSAPVNFAMADMYKTDEAVPTSETDYSALADGDIVQLTLTATVSTLTVDFILEVTMNDNA